MTKSLYEQGRLPGLAYWPLFYLAQWCPGRWPRLRLWLGRQAARAA